MFFRVHISCNNDTGVFPTIQSILTVVVKFKIGREKEFREVNYPGLRNCSRVSPAIFLSAVKYFTDPTCCEWMRLQARVSSSYGPTDNSRLSVGIKRYSYYSSSRHYSLNSSCSFVHYEQVYCKENNVTSSAGRTSARQETDFHIAIGSNRSLHLIIHNRTQAFNTLWMLVRVLLF